MTVRELIEALSQESPDRVVVMASDAEGNSYALLSGFWTGAFAPDSPGCGRGGVGLETLTEEDERRGYSEEDLLEGTPALILSPC